MNKNAFAYADDMEMILQAFLERRYQSYFDYKKNNKSKVIRLKQTFGGDD